MNNYNLSRIIKFLFVFNGRNKESNGSTKIGDHRVRRESKLLVRFAEPVQSPTLTISRDVKLRHEICVQ